MANVALTTIRHGKDDGSVVVVKEGDEVKGLPKDVVEDLKSQGLIGEPAVSTVEQDEQVEKLEAENEDLQKQVEELQAKLAEAEEGKTPPTPPAK